VMARHKDTIWNLPEGGPDGHQWNSIHSALLMDIRDELKQLNTLLHCENFISIPRILRSIRRNTTKPRRSKAK
jgi:hypothetical protein